MYRTVYYSVYHIVSYRANIETLVQYDILNLGTNMTNSKVHGENWKFTKRLSSSLHSAKKRATNIGSHAR